MEFKEAFDLLVDREGGYANDPNDPGKETKFGISKRSYPHLDIKALTLEDAESIYRTDFWNGSMCQSFPDPLRFQLFDTAVNSGTHRAVALLQKALGVPSDGVLGPITRAAAANINSVGALTIRFIAVRLRFMTTLETWDHFGRGWARRIADNLEEAMR